MRKRVWSLHTTRNAFLLSGKMLRRSLFSSSVRSFSANARYELPPFAGEPFKHYPPGSSDALSLKAELNRAKSEVVEIPCIVNGKEYFTGDIQEQVMPSNNKHVLARFHKATPEVVQEAIKVSQAAREEWASFPFEHRAMVFKRAGDLIAGKYRNKIMASTMLGTGKTVWQAEIDAAVETVDFLRINNKFAEMIYSVQPPLNSPNCWNRLRYRELEGFILAISPFNFCAIGANLCASPALMGNTVLWKPASTSVFSNYVTYQVFQEAGIPPGVISFLPSTGRTIGSAINHRDFGGLHFTGSTATFNTLWNQIGKNLDNYKSYPRIVGETGGKNFHLIHPSADLESAVFNTVRASFEYQGQKCSACSRLYVPKSLWPKFKSLMLETMATIKIGQADDFQNFMSAVIDRQAYSDHVDFIEKARASSDCEIITGGTYSDEIGNFVNPTVIVTTNPRFLTMEKEIFGPVLTVYVYEDSEWADTLKLVDTTSPYALTGAIFARDRSALVQAQEALKHSAGNLYLNDKSTGAVVGEQPFGGARLSGTNDKAGSHLNLLRWISAQTIKETTVPLTGIGYPHMD